MASTRLLLEGSDIEDLLERVREEHGPGVRIVHADKLRSGGVAGFFAREKFAVTIELDDVNGSTTASAAKISAAPRGVDEPGTLLELADAIDAAEAAEASVTMSTASMSLSPRPAVPVVEAPPVVPPGLGPLSTEGARFADVLAGLAKTTRSNGSSELSSDAPDVFVPASLSKVPAPAPASQPRHALEMKAPNASPATPDMDMQDSYRNAGRRRRAGDVARTATPNVIAATAEQFRNPNPLVSRLLDLGLPAELATQLEGVGLANLRENLVRVLSQRTLPTVRDLQAGDVLVVAGPAALAYEVACDLARRLRLDVNDVLLAAPSELGVRIDPDARISGPVDARRRSGRMRRADVPTIVAVDAPIDASSADWAREIADALGARVMWALVDATSKPGDVLDHLTGLGRLDGLVVRGTAATRDPASVLAPALALALPTVLLDGRPGDAEAWANLLISRIDELT